MAGYLDNTIEWLINQIELGEIVLPSMQRNFVWPEEKVIDLFDSLMKGYPIGTFLFWEMDNNTFDQFFFNKFLSMFDEQQRKYQRAEKATNDRQHYYAVLDGQQRITSMYLGIKGSYRAHKKNKKWEDDSSYIMKYFCINLFHVPSGIDDGYQFGFKSQEEITISYDSVQPQDGDEFWYPIKDILSNEYISDTTGAFNSRLLKNKLQNAFFTGGLSDEMSDGLQIIAERLYGVICNSKVISFYPTQNLPLPKVIDIFRRVNSGGQKLAASDLMLSIASSKFPDRNLQGELNDAVKRIRAVGGNFEFDVDKEFVLTAGLMCTGAETLSMNNTDNWDIQVLKPIVDDLVKITDAICNALLLLQEVGVQLNKIPSRNSILPIVFYFYIYDLKANYAMSQTDKAIRDREYIRQWFIRAIVCGLFSDAINNTLKIIRRRIKKAKADGKNYYPLDDLMDNSVKKGKELIIGEDEIAKILDYRYDDAETKIVLAEITSILPGTKYDVDHIWPKTILLRKGSFKKAYSEETQQAAPDGLYEEYNSRCHGIANLQLLSDAENKAKGEMLYHKWLETKKSNPTVRARYFEEQIIPTGDDCEYDFKSFVEFYKKREKLLKKAIKDSFPPSFQEIITRNGWDM